MQKTFFCVFMIGGVLFFEGFSLAFGQMMSSVGVARGDVFSYGYNCFFNSNDPAAVPPASFSWINQTGYFMINVTGVSGSSISFDTTMHGLNGTNSLGVCSMNVDRGLASISGYGGPSEPSNFYFMTRNVGMMSRMFPSSISSPTINDTALRSYESGQRLTNHFVTTNTHGRAILQSDFYFDQATGMMVEWEQQTIQVNGNLQTNSTQMMKITSSSVWVIPEFPTSAVIPTFVAVAFFTGLAMMVARKFKSEGKLRK